MKKPFIFLAVAMSVILALVAAYMIPTLAWAGDKVKLNMAGTTIYVPDGSGGYIHLKVEVYADAHLEVDGKVTGICDTDDKLISISVDLRGYSEDPDLEGVYSATPTTNIAFGYNYGGSYETYQSSNWEMTIRNGKLRFQADFAILP